MLSLQKIYYCKFTTIRGTPFPNGNIWSISHASVSPNTHGKLHETTSHRKDINSKENAPTESQLNALVPPLQRQRQNTKLIKYIILTERKATRSNMRTCKST